MHGCLPHEQESPLRARIDPPGRRDLIPASTSDLFSSLEEAKLIVDGYFPLRGSCTDPVEAVLLFFGFTEPASSYLDESEDAINIHLLNTNVRVRVSEDAPLCNAVNPPSHEIVHVLRRNKDHEI